MRKVVVIGGGFCGVVTAVNLARLTDTPLAVTVLNAAHPMGRGVAYGAHIGGFGAGLVLVKLFAAGRR